MDNFTSIIGDIVDSRNIDNRLDVQRKLEEVLGIINEKYKDSIASKFTITLGDEFQGLLWKPDFAIKIITDIELLLCTVNIRFGVGIGEISTELNPEKPFEVDGPAFHRARKAITTIKDKKSQYLESISNIIIIGKDEDQLSIGLVNTILSLCTAIKYKWTDRQKEIIKTYMVCDKNQYKTAKALDIGQSSVNKALKSTNFYTYREAMENISHYLRENQ